MATRKSTPTAPISKKEIAALTRKLDDWGASLPPAEQALLQLIVSKAQLVDPDEVRAQQTREALSVAVQDVFKNLTKQWQGGKEGWAKIGPVWYKKNKLNPGEEVEISAKVQLKGR